MKLPSTFLLPTTPFLFNMVEQNRTEQNMFCSTCPIRQEKETDTKKVKLFLFSDGILMY